MTNDEKQALLPKPNYTDISLGDVIDIIKPHTYVITPKHLLPDHMYLDIEEAERQGAICDACRYWNKKEGKPILSYKDHVKDATVLFVKVNAQGRTPNEVPHLNEFLKSLVPTLEQLKIDGVSLVDTTKKGKK